MSDHLRLLVDMLEKLTPDTPLEILQEFLRMLVTRPEPRSPIYQKDMLRMAAERMKMPLEKMNREVDKILLSFDKRLISPLAIINFYAISISDFKKKILPERPAYLSWLKKKSITMIYGKRGSGKTFARDVTAIALAYALDIGEWKCIESTGVLIVDGEMVDQDTQERYRALTANLGEPQKPLTLFTSDNVSNEGFQRPLITAEAWRTAFAQYLKEHPEYGVLMLDNLSSLAPGIDENAKNENDDLNQWYLDLRSQGLAVLFFHHEGKKGESSRGTSAREDNVDNVIHVTEVEKNPKLCKSRIEFTKYRGRRGPETDPFILSIVDDPKIPGRQFWTTTSGGKELPRDNWLAIMRLLGQGKKNKEIAEVIGVGCSRVSNVKKAAIKKDYLTKAGKPTPKWREQFGIDDDSND